MILVIFLILTYHRANLKKVIGIHQDHHNAKKTDFLSVDIFAILNPCRNNHDNQTFNTSS